MNWIKIIAINFLLLLPLLSFAEETATEKFATAVAAQNEGNIAKSIATYQNLLESDQLSPALYNNLGLAYATQKNIGKAILNFERALMLDPNFDPAKKNLAAANQRLQNPISAPSAVFFVRWWNNTSNLFSAFTWSILFLVLLSGGAGLFAWGHWQSQSSYKKLGIGVLCFSLLPFIIGGQQTSLLQDSSMAIITTKKVGIRQNPALDSPEIEIIAAGIKVKILEQKERWLYIRLPNSLVGWVPQKMVTSIRK